MTYVLDFNNIWHYSTCEPYILRALTFCNQEIIVASYNNSPEIPYNICPICKITNGKQYNI